MANVYKELLTLLHWARTEMSHPEMSHPECLIEVNATHMSGEYSKRSLSFSFEGKFRLAQLTIWETGESEMEWANVDPANDNEGRRSDVLRTLPKMMNEVLMLVGWIEKPERDDL